MAEPSLENANQPDAPGPSGIATPAGSGDAGGSAPAAAVQETGTSPKISRKDYTRNLLAIEVPVLVTLASQRKNIRDIVGLGPGSIVKFGKTYGEPLDISAGGRIIARGEVVKVGDKFGVRVSSLVK
ncbi:MAG: FliM/FliN family flagellar motor switch protein [Pirellulales bacterium]|nr:FliM/FliN family flagellar motor switch protein [Pirellulales bacterium]